MVDLLIRGFETFDKSIIDDLFSLLPSDYESLPDEELTKVINDQESGGKVYKAVIRCMRGSTAIVSLLNPEKSDVWVANLGDCQASKDLLFCSLTRFLIADNTVLAECFVDAPDDFKTTLLSTPHNPRSSEKELKRVKSEHPEEPTAIMNHRILGALAVSRGEL